MAPPHPIDLTDEESQEQTLKEYLRMMIDYYRLNHPSGRFGKGFALTLMVVKDWLSHQPVLDLKWKDVDFKMKGDTP